MLFICVKTISGIFFICGTEFCFFHYSTFFLSSSRSESPDSRANCFQLQKFHIFHSPYPRVQVDCSYRHRKIYVKAICGYMWLYGHQPSRENQLFQLVVALASFGSSGVKFFELFQSFILSLT